MKILVFNLGLSLLGMTTLLAQRVGFINDADGYTNLRAAASSQSEIISVIRQGEEFTYYPKNNANWYQVDFKGKSGFMHKSRIKSLGQLKAELNNFFNAISLFVYAFNDLFFSPCLYLYQHES